MVHRPAWFKDDQVFVSYAPTVGINKKGEELYVIDGATGTRTTAINDKLAEDVTALASRGETTDTSRWISRASLTDRLVAVPTYFDERPLLEFDALMKLPDMAGFTSATIGQLLQDGMLVATSGHGSPSADRRTGQVPYIKVSDIRAGQVNTSTPLLTRN